MCEISKLMLNWNKVALGTGFWQDNRGIGVRVPAEARMFTSPYLAARSWGQSNFLVGNGAGGIQKG
jgi:hypothetical protein